MSDKRVDVPELTPKDFQSSQEVKWCAGCGDYSILAQVQRTLPTLGIPKEKFVWISGIGCSSRFPYYMDTFGMHGIHGRAAAIATGVKLNRPDLAVWVATGDGDLLSIGGNHFIHSCRKNIDLKIILFNNRIYGLTKGQFSPTSELGKKTKTSPYGTTEYPFNPLSLAIGSGATLVARAIDRDPKFLKDMIDKIAQHRGLAFLEVFQNCSIFNDGTYANLTDKETKDDAVVKLEHGKPMIFGKERNKGIRVEGMTPHVVDLDEGDYSADDLWVHDETDECIARAAILSHIEDRPGFPTPVGVFRSIRKKTYDEMFREQIDAAHAKGGGDSFADLLEAKNVWEVN
ncbi:MAG: 2-oxoacid:ferredoxin oxidoreductase subunit beta [Ignavibacteriales bacterium]|nr:2-oxoacid:ferredoxin oxidoreductase subunit beta [Ignavibacteriales bacterium]